jgi:hypothetical protein
VRHALALSVALGIFGVAASACTGQGDLEGTPLDGANAAPQTGTGAACEETPPPPTDPATLPSCCAEGAARCVPGASVPSAGRARFATCAGGYCVPEPLIKEPTRPLAHCASMNGADGVCASLCIPQLAQYKDLLPRSTCAADERCAPCTSPLDGKPTGACEVPSCGNGGPPAAPHSGAACPHEGPPVVDPASLPACSDVGGAHCVDAKLVPPGAASQLATCPTGLCAPDTFIASGGQLIPPTCRSFDDAEGRCLHLALPKIAAQRDRLPRSTCAAYERCVPCYDPLEGSETGACKLSCNPGPKEPKKVLAACCSGRGRCIPDSSVPSAQRGTLTAHECASPNLCAPTEMLGSVTPQACAAPNPITGGYTGVCLSECLDFGLLGLALLRGSCDATHVCVPCKDPLGAATGAPGCPP